jgi:hypothetical protein
MNERYNMITRNNLTIAPIEREMMLNPQMEEEAAARMDRLAELLKEIGSGGQRNE